MDVLTAHGMIASRPDEGRSLMPSGFEIEAVPGLEPIVPLVTAAVSLSGALKAASTQADLDNAAKHFESLLRGGIVSTDQWSAEAEAVIGEVVKWGDNAEYN